MQINLILPNKIINNSNSTQQIQLLIMICHVGKPHHLTTLQRCSKHYVYEDSKYPRYNVRECMGFAVSQLSLIHI